MSYLAKLLPLAALLASFDGNAVFPPLFAQESSALQSPSPSPMVEPTPADTNSWSPLAQRLEAENRRLVQERDHWHAEALKCQARLQRAEQSLSLMTAKDLTAVLEDPEVRVTGNDVLVTAHMLNLGDQVSQGTASIDLLLDNKVVATAKEPVSIAPGSDLSVTHLFPGLAGKGVFSAKLRFDP